MQLPSLEVLAPISKPEICLLNPYGDFRVYCFEKGLFLFGTRPESPSVAPGRLDHQFSKVAVIALSILAFNLKKLLKASLTSFLDWLLSVFLRAQGAHRIATREVTLCAQLVTE
jgi:hypothetical protein